MKTAHYKIKVYRKNSTEIITGVDFKICPQNEENPSQNKYLCEVMEQAKECGCVLLKNEKEQSVAIPLANVDFITVDMERGLK